MNKTSWSILSIAVMLLLVGGGAVLFLIRSNQLNTAVIEENAAKKNATEPDVFDNGLPMRPKTAQETEKFASTGLLRGSFAKFDSQTNKLNVIETMGRDKGKEIVLDVSRIDKVACWPASVRNADGSVTLLQDAYIPVPPGGVLAWPTQTEEDLSRTLSSLSSTTHLIIRFTNSDFTKETNIVAQLVVLGCNE